MKNPEAVIGFPSLCQRIFLPPRFPAALDCDAVVTPILAHQVSDLLTAAYGLTPDEIAPDVENRSAADPDWRAPNTYAPGVTFQSPGSFAPAGIRCLGVCF
jgi:hypothetical protein